ncbi:MAG: protein translocase subunit SecD [Candidatus Methylomirabilales bacterium]
MSARVLPVKRALGFRVSLIGLASLLSVLYLLPSWLGEEGLPAWWRYVRPLIVASPPEPIRLGLDLQGGMHLVLEVEEEQAVTNVVERRVAEIRRALEREEIPYARLERRGARQILLEVAEEDARTRAVSVLAVYEGMSRTEEEGTILLTLGDAEAARIRESAVDQTVEKIRNRVDEFGVREPLIHREGETRIIVQLPGIKDPERAINLIGKTAQLEFKLLDNQHSLEEALRGKVPEGSEILYGKLVDESGTVIRRIPYLLEKKTLLTGDVLTSAGVRFDPDTNLPYVSIEFDREGAQLFAELTEKNVGRYLAIVLDGTVYSAPRVNEKIPGGRGQITGRFTPEEARDLAIVLRAGALPAPVQVIGNLTVGPSLGQDSIRAGLRASLLAGLLVILIMAAYYRAAGLIADAALLLNLLLVLAALAAFHATLTLPGIAGIALTIGIAVDSNILILERIREELRLGKTIRSAIDAGYSKAWVTILDSHVTALITAFALFLFGTGPVRGFAVTLSIGVIVNLFTATVGTKVVYDWLILRGMKTLRV